MHNDNESYTHLWCTGDDVLTTYCIPTGSSTCERDTLVPVGGCPHKLLYRCLIFSFLTPRLWAKAVWRANTFPLNSTNGLIQSAQDLGDRKKETSERHACVSLTSSLLTLTCCLSVHHDLAPAAEDNVHEHLHHTGSLVFNLKTSMKVCSLFTHGQSVPSSCD